MQPKLVIFDCDGVLVDSEPVSNQVLRDSLAGHGLDLDIVESTRIFTGLTLGGVIKQAMAMGARLPETWAQELTSIEHKRLQKGVDPIAGVEVVLRRLRGVGIPFCVASNGEFEKMRITLGYTGLIGYFQGAMYSAPALGTAKPDPALFLHAARQFEVAACDCVVIEDSVSGALAAKRAGMACFGYAATGEGGALAKIGATVFDRMDALPGLLGF